MLTIRTAFGSLPLLLLGVAAQARDHSFSHSNCEIIVDQQALTQQFSGLSQTAGDVVAGLRTQFSRVQITPKFDVATTFLTEGAPSEDLLFLELKVRRLGVAIEVEAKLLNHRRLFGHGTLLGIETIAQVKGIGTPGSHALWERIAAALPACAPTGFAAKQHELFGKFIHASSAQDVTTLKSLVEQGLEPSGIIHQYGVESPLSDVIGSLKNPEARHDMVRFLLAHGAMPDFQNPRYPDESTPVFECPVDDIGCYQLLHDAGARLDRERVDSNGSLVSRALSSNAFPLLDYLHQQGVSPNLKGSDGNSALMGALDGFSNATSATLLEFVRRYSPDLSIQNQKGETAIFLSMGDYSDRDGALTNLMISRGGTLGSSEKNPSPDYCNTFCKAVSNSNTSWMHWAITHGSAANVASRDLLGRIDYGFREHPEVAAFAVREMFRAGAIHGDIKLDECPNSLASAAIYLNDLSFLDESIHAGTDLIKTRGRKGDDSWTTALKLAQELGRDRLIARILQEDPRHEKAFNYEYAVKNAIDNSQIEVLDAMFKAGISPENTIGKEPNSCWFLHALKYRDVDDWPWAEQSVPLVKVFFRYGMRPELKCEESYGPKSPLAMVVGNRELFQIVLDAGALPAHVPEAMTQAVQSRDSYYLQTLIDRGGNPTQWSHSDGFNPYSYSPLTVAAKAGNLAAVEILLRYPQSSTDPRNPTDPNFPSSQSRSALSVAAKNSHWDVVDRLLDAGLNPTRSGNGTASALFYSLAAKKLELAQRLLSFGAPDDLADSDSPYVRKAIETESPEVLEGLLRFSVPYYGKQTGSIHAAANLARPDLMRLLVQYSKSADEFDAEYDWFHQSDWYTSSWPTPLYLSALKNDVESTKLLLKEGARVNGNHYAPPLMAAACSDGADVAVLLISKGARLDVTEKSQGLFGRAAECGNTPFLELFLNRGQAIDEQVSNFGSALNVAAVSGKPLAVKFLLEHGASTEIQGYDSDSHQDATLLYLSAKDPEKETLLLLIPKVKHLNVLSSNGRTAVSRFMSNMIWDSNWDGEHYHFQVADVLEVLNAFAAAGADFRVRGTEIQGLLSTMERWRGVGKDQITQRLRELGADSR